MGEKLCEQEGREAHLKAEQQKEQMQADVLLW